MLFWFPILNRRPSISSQPVHTPSKISMSIRRHRQRNIIYQCFTSFGTQTISQSKCSFRLKWRVPYSCDINWESERENAFTISQGLLAATGRRFGFFVIFLGFDMTVRRERERVFHIITNSWRRMSCAHHNSTSLAGNQFSNDISRRTHFRNANSPIF